MDTTVEDEESSRILFEDMIRRRTLRKIQTEFVPYQREEIARILTIVAEDGLPNPRDLDAALDAIQAAVFD